MGDWHYYTTLMSLRDVAQWITGTDQIHSNEHLREWIQRELQANRIDEIASYLVKQPQRFFNALIVGIHEGDPEWFPIVVGDSPVVGSPQLDEVATGAFGLLRLKGGEKVFAIDGQHRVEGIRRALEREPEVGAERIAVLFVAHRSTSEGRERTRRLFSTVNRHAKPVSKGEIVALDEDDAYAVVTRRLVESFDLLKGHRVAFGKQTPIKKNDKSSITSILGLYDIVQQIHYEGIGTKGTPLRVFKARRPPDETITRIEKQQHVFWTTLSACVPAVCKVLTATEAGNAAAAFRHEDGGHVLFRPVGQRAFARATRVLMNRGTALKKAIRTLTSTPFDLASAPWTGVLWDPVRRVMLTKSPQIVLAQNLFLYYGRQRPEPATYDLREAYTLASGAKRLPKRQSGQ